MRPAVWILHATGFTYADQVFKSLGSALLALTLSDGHTGFKFFELPIYYVGDAVFNLVDVQALRTGRARGVDCEAFRALTGALDIVLLTLTRALTDAIK
jgi:hypothetical protein